MAHVRRKAAAAGKSDDGPGDAKKRRRVLSDSEDDDDREKRGGSAAPPPSTPVGSSKYGGDSYGGGALAAGSLRQQSGGGGGLSSATAASSEKHKPAELFRKDLISAMKMPDSEPLLPEEYIVISDPWRQEWEKGVQVPVNSEFILEPKICVTAEPEKTGTFKLPRKLVHVADDQAYSPTVHELSEVAGLAEKACRYDLDDLDVAWLECYNYERHQMGQEPVPEYIMEKVMEELESLCHDNMEETIRNSDGLGIEYDENVVCDVCRSPDSEENNEMVFCDGCDVCVHQACYGVHKIPDGAWLCRTCALGIKPQCVLCPKMGGAMKATKSGRTWAHVSCALWIPEVSIGDAEKMEPVTKISHIPPSRWSLVCSLCREKTGACIQCDLRACKTAFHVTCAFEHKLEMKTVVDESSVGGDVKLKAYCQKHTEEHRASGAADGEVATPIKMTSTRSTRDPTSSPNKKDMTDAERAGARSQNGGRFCRIAELSNSFYTYVKPADVASKLRRDPDSGGLDLDGGGICCGGTVEELVDFVYQYWKLKRRSWYNAALLTPKTEEADFLTRQQEDSLIARMKMFVHLRQDLEKVRNLCYMISKREKTRKAFYKVREELFHKQLECLLLLGEDTAAERVEDLVAANRSDSIYDDPARWEPRETAQQQQLAAAVAPPPSTPDKAAAASKAQRSHAADKAASRPVALQAGGKPAASAGDGAADRSAAATPAARPPRGPRPGADSVEASASVAGRAVGKDKGRHASTAARGPAQSQQQATGNAVSPPLPSPMASKGGGGEALPGAGRLSKYKIDEALRNVVHGRIFHTRRPKPYVNGVFDRTQRRLDSYFPKPPARKSASGSSGSMLESPCNAAAGQLRGGMSSPETRSARRRIAETGGSLVAAAVCKSDKLFESIDSEVSVSLPSPGATHHRSSRGAGLTLNASGGGGGGGRSCADAVELDKENNGSNGSLSDGACDDEALENGRDDSDADVVADDVMYPVVSDTFPKRVTRSRISESLAKVWNAVTGAVYRN